MVTSRRCFPPETRIRETRTILDYIQGNLGLILGFDSLKREIEDSYPEIEKRYGPSKGVPPDIPALDFYEIPHLL